MVKKSLKGGNANVFPNPGNSAYGSYVPQSLGQSLSNSFFGTNMGVYPNSSVVQTGGDCDYNTRSYNNPSKNSKSNGKSNGKKATKNSKSNGKSNGKGKGNGKSKKKSKSKSKGKGK